MYSIDRWFLSAAEPKDSRPYRSPRGCDYAEWDAAARWIAGRSHLDLSEFLGEALAEYERLGEAKEHGERVEADRPQGRGERSRRRGVERSR